MQNTTKAWLHKAESGYRTAQLAAKMKPPSADHICFWSQQAAEKYLQAFLVESGTPGPRIHDLEKLLNLALRHDRTLGNLRRGLALLTKFADDEGFSTDDATLRQSRSALIWAERVRTDIRRRLKLRP
jgi:HEPN domain-containing protein